MSSRSRRAALRELGIEVDIVPDLTVSGSPIDEGYCSSRSPERMSIADLARHLQRSTIRQTPAPEVPQPSSSQPTDEASSEPIPRPTTPQNYFRYVREQRQLASLQHYTPPRMQRVTHFVRRALDYSDPSSGHRHKKMKHNPSAELGSPSAPSHEPSSSSSSTSTPQSRPSSPDDGETEAGAASKSYQQIAHASHLNEIFSITERNRVHAVERTVRMRKRLGGVRRNAPTA
jgi:hypothetical protein